MDVLASNCFSIGLTGFSLNRRFDKQYLNSNRNSIMDMYIITQLQKSIHVTGYNYDQLDLTQLVRHRVADKRCTQTIEMYGRR